MKKKYVAYIVIIGMLIFILISSTGKCYPIVINNDNNFQADILEGIYITGDNEKNINNDYWKTAFCLDTPLWISSLF